MIQENIDKLLEINRVFYADFGDAFAATRRRIQPGVWKVLNGLPGTGSPNWLDLGCGSGALGQSWAEQSRSGSYTGLDFSEPLLAEARRTAGALSNDRLKITYYKGDLMDADWSAQFSEEYFDGVLAFASLHHVPAAYNHERIFREVFSLLRPGGNFIFSVWQFQNSKKLMQRVLPWSMAGIEAEELEPGDTLLDWRYSLPGDEARLGTRYVHLFTENELSELANYSGFTVENCFYSDGAEGNLALYMICRKKII